MTTLIGRDIQDLHRVLQQDHHMLLMEVIISTLRHLVIITMQMLFWYPGLSIPVCTQWKIYCWLEHILDTVTIIFMHFSFNLVAKSGCLLIFMPFSFDLVVNGGCLRFDYHMYGTTINTLNVNVFTVENGTQRLWWRHGNQGNVWSNAIVPLPRSSSLRVSKISDSVWWRFYDSSDHRGSNKL